MFGLVRFGEVVAYVFRGLFWMLFQGSRICWAPKLVGSSIVLLEKYVCATTLTRGNKVGH